METPKFTEIVLSKGLALGISIDKNELQIAIIFFIIAFNFNVVADGLKRFRECLRD